MLKLFLTVPAFALSALPAAAQQATPAVTAAGTAKGMQEVVGKVFDGGITFKAVTAEGNTVVLTVSGPRGWTDGMTTADISTSLVGGFCQKAPDFFAAGLTMRVDTVDDTAMRTGPLTTACPPVAQ